MPFAGILTSAAFCDKGKTPAGAKLRFQKISLHFAGNRLQYERTHKESAFRTFKKSKFSTMRE